VYLSGCIGGGTQIRPEGDNVTEALFQPCPNPRFARMFHMEKKGSISSVIHIDILNAENRQPEFSKQKIFFGSDAGAGYWTNWLSCSVEIMAIAEYLEETHPQPVFESDNRPGARRSADWTSGSI